MDGLLTNRQEAKLHIWGLLVLAIVCVFVMFFCGCGQSQDYVPRANRQAWVENHFQHGNVFTVAGEPEEIKVDGLNIPVCRVAVHREPGETLLETTFSALVIPCRMIGYGEEIELAEITYWHNDSVLGGFLLVKDSRAPSD